MKKTIFPVFVFLSIALLPLAPLRAESGAAQVPEKKSVDLKHVQQVFDDIAARNKTFKRSPEWLKEAYGGVKIRKINDISQSEFASYKKFVDNGDVYVIVHPAYYTFFHPETRIAEELPAGFPAQSVVERFAGTVPPGSLMYRILLEQEHLLRDFLEYASVEKKLVILILPGDYKNNVIYKPRPGFDEYARYINDLTNMSESIVYMESQEVGNGFVENNDLKILSAFLEQAGIKNILLGGGYLGRCVDDFYRSIRKSYPYEQIYFVPELSAIRPNDQAADKLNFFTEKGEIEFKSVIKYLRVITGMMRDFSNEKPRIRRLSLYPVYR